MLQFISDNILWVQYGSLNFRSKFTFIQIYKLKLQLWRWRRKRKVWILVVCMNNFEKAALDLQIKDMRKKFALVYLSIILVNIWQWQRTNSIKRVFHFMWKHPYWHIWIFIKDIFMLNRQMNSTIITWDICMVNLMNEIRKWMI